MQRIFQIIFLFFATSVLTLLLSCGNLGESETSDSDTSRGSVASFTSNFYPSSFLAGLLQQTIDAQTDESIKAAVQAQNILTPYAVNQYNITYHTIDANGNPTLASAALLVPSYNQNIDLVVYMHGTTSKRADAPSLAYADFSSYDGIDPSTIDTNLSTKQESVVGSLFTSEGVGFLLPDYLGFGASTGIHPYIHAESLASSTIDAIRAAINFQESSAVSFTLSKDIVLAGYSEGGYAVMATHKELVTNASDYSDIGITLKGVIPGSPPCNLTTAMANAMLNDADYPYPPFAAFIAVAYDSIYSDIDFVDQFKPSYDGIDNYFDGSYSLTEIGAAFGMFNPDSTSTVGTPISLFSDAFKTDITTAFDDYSTNNTLDTPSTYGVFEKLIANNVHNYVDLSTPVYFVHLNADSIVPSSNSGLAYEYMYTNSATPGVNLGLIEPSVILNVGEAAYNTNPALYFTQGTETDHALGGLYYFFVMRTLYGSFFTQ